MIDILIFIIVAVVAFGLGWRLRETYAKHILMQYYDQIEKIASEAKSNVIHVEITQHGESFLIHDCQTGKFLVQGSSFDDAVKALYNTYPGKLFTADPTVVKTLKNNDAV